MNEIENPVAVCALTRDEMRPSHRALGGLAVARGMNVPCSAKRAMFGRRPSSMYWAVNSGSMPSIPRITNLLGYLVTFAPALFSPGVLHAVSMRANAAMKVANRK